MFLDPPEGNCAPGCTFDASSTHVIELTELIPGRDYMISLTAESYGKASEPFIVTQGLDLAPIVFFQTVCWSEEVSTSFSYMGEENKTQVRVINAPASDQAVPD